MQKKWIWGLGCLALAIVFVLLPLPASDLILRVYFDKVQGDYCALYYSTEPDKSFTGEKYLVSGINYDRNMVEFWLDGSLEDQITALRLDWPGLDEELLCVKTITVSSGGVIQKEFNPCVFFAEGNIAFEHETSVTLVQPRKRAYLLIDGDDPYHILSDGLTEQIRKCCSHRGVSRFFCCLFLAGSFFLARRKLFDDRG